MSWSWSFIPQRLMAEESFLDLSMVDRGLLFSLYHRCDKWGRGPGRPRALATLVGSFDVAEVSAGMERLYASGLVLRVGQDWELLRYDEDAKPVGLLKRRNTPSEFGNAPVTVPTPSDNVGHRPTTSDGSGTTSGDCPQTSASNETRRDETRLAPEAGAPGVRAPAPAHARVYEPDPEPVPEPPPPPAPPPDPVVAEAVGQWQRRYSQLVPTGMLDDASVLTVARDFTPTVFAAAVERHIGEDAQFWSRNALRYLRVRCEWARDRPPPVQRPATAPSRRRGKTFDELTPAELAELGGT